MPSVRIERVPVQSFGLGILGFDHLQVVFVPPGGSERNQDSWLVIEGLREPHGGGVRLAVEGYRGGLTLAEANGGLSGDELADKIGTAEMRGSREIVSGGQAFETWASLVSYATEIEQQQFPYVAYALPSSPTPTINSSSLISSLLYHSGIDIGAVLPFGLRLSPGTGTLLGTSGDDRLALDGTRFSAVLGGEGRDEIVGTAAAGHVDKLYGGRGDDQLRWSPGFDILHGGQPDLAYVEDGLDTVSYAGVGRLHLNAGAYPSAHSRPDFVTSFANGTSHLYSIEELTWDDAHDTVVLGTGIALERERLRLSLGGGDDFVDGGEAGFATLVDGADGMDTLIAGLAGMTGRGGAGADRFVLASPGAVLTVLDAEPADRLYVPWEFAEARAEACGENELVIKIMSERGRIAVVHVLDFQAGDLGLSLRAGEPVLLEVDNSRALVDPAGVDPVVDYDFDAPFGAILDDPRHG